VSVGLVVVAVRLIQAERLELALLVVETAVLQAILLLEQ
jgi:hypothetical protein